jgi:hypothetical protein
MKTRSILIAAIGCASLAAGAQSSSGAASQPQSSGSGTVISTQPQHTEAMQKLTQAAQRLRESIQAMAQKKTGPDRDAAMSKAQEALLDTQRAMVQLPPDMRSLGTVSTVSYDESVKKLMKASDSLRESIQAMAQQPAGERRNQAIRQANEALLETQSAMAMAYTPNTGSNASKMGASGSGASGSSGSSSSTAATSANAPKPLGGPAAHGDKK